MGKQLARQVASGFDRQVSLLSTSHVDALVDTIQSLTVANAREENELASVSKSTLASSYGYKSYAEEKPFVFADGIAFIPISGMLVNRFNWCWMGWLTGYNFIRDQLNAALDDNDVKMILFDVNSPGGMVHGCFELANDIYNSRSVKPSVAVVDSIGFSGAYALASSASRVVVTPSGSVGSIGSLLTHIERSGALKEAGIKVNLIYSGDHKVDGNPFEALPTSVRAKFQKELDSVRQEFVNLVARNRNLDTKVVYDTEAETYHATEALQLGLIDAIAPPVDAVQACFNELSGSENDKETTMSKQEASPSAEANTAQGQETSAAQSAAAQTATQEGVPLASAEQVDAKVAERQRIQGILTCDEAKGRTTLANHLALDTELSVEAAKKILTASAVETKQEASSFIDAMASSEHPNVGAEALGTGVQGAEAKSRAKEILSAQALVNGESK